MPSGGPNTGGIQWPINRREVNPGKQCRRKDDRLDRSNCQRWRTSNQGMRRVTLAMLGATLAFQAASTNTVGIIEVAQPIRGRFVRKSLPDVRPKPVHYKRATRQLLAHVVMDML